MWQFWRVRRGPLILGCTALFLVLGLGYELAAWFDFASWPESRRIYRENPAVARLPVDLPDLVLAPLHGVTAYPFGFAIQTPWRKLGTIEMQGEADYVPFPEERVTMTFFKPANDSFNRKMWADLQHRDPYQRIVTSNYSMLAAILSATPEQLKWWRTNRQNEASSFLLEEKALILGRGRSIYAITVGHFHGFQEGDPAMFPYGVRLDLFDSADLHYVINVSPDNHRNPALTQAQLNAMVASLRRDSPN